MYCISLFFLIILYLWYLFVFSTETRVTLKAGEYNWNICNKNQYDDTGPNMLVYNNDNSDKNLNLMAWNNWSKFINC